MKRSHRTVLAAAVAAALAGGLTGALTGTAAAAPAAVKPVKTDFNGDGFGDAAVTAPAAWRQGKWRVGSVTALYGSAHGVSAANHTTFDQDSPGVPGAAENGDLFGAATASGDRGATVRRSAPASSPSATRSGWSRSSASSR